MAAAPGWNRRSLFRSLTPSLRTSVACRSELTVARRAMACEFSVIFPFGVRGGVDAGCAALDEVERLEQKLSVYRLDSDLSSINRTAAERPVRTDAELYSLLRLAVRLSHATDGAFDAATGALVAAWGFFRGPRRVPTESERVAALAAGGSCYVRFDDPERTVAFGKLGVEFNLGAIGKGYAIDRALARVRAEFGVPAALMQGGQSSLKALGAPVDSMRGWAIDIGDPAVARVWLQDRALGTSGAANQYFVCDGRRYGHILDPRTGWPADGVESASVIAPTAAEADALSTAFFVLGVEGTRRFCRKHPEIAAVLVLPGDPKPIVIGKADVEVLV